MLQTELRKPRQLGQTSRSPLSFQPVTTRWTAPFRTLRWSQKIHLPWRNISLDRANRQPFFRYFFRYFLASAWTFGLTIQTTVKKNRSKKRKYFLQKKPWQPSRNMVDLQYGGTPLPPSLWLYTLSINSALRLYYYKIGGFISQNIKGDTHYNNAKYNINTSQTQNNIK